MQSKAISLMFIAALCTLALCRPLPAAAVSSVTLSPSGENGFILQGNGIEDAAAMEINISYDSATINNPRVTEGPLIAGAMTAVNPNLPGTVRMVIIRLTPVRGSGVIATLTFNRTGPSPGGINSLSVRLSNISGTPLPVFAQVSNPPAASPDSSVSAERTNTSGTPAQIAGADSAVAQSPVPPTVLIVGPPDAADQGKERTKASSTADRDAQQSADESPTGLSVNTTRGAADAVVAKNAPTSDAKRLYSQKSILERFREYRGERTAAALIDLFRQENMIGIRQDPVIAFSDGKSTVKVTFLSTPGNGKASDVAVMGARLLSLKKDPDNTNTWIAELMPEQGTSQASLAVSQGDVQLIYPLTVVPRADLLRANQRGVSKNDFMRYLNSRGAAGAAAVDLNHDARQDYLDDYIFTANYLDAVEQERRITREARTGLTGQGIR